MNARVDGRDSIGNEETMHLKAARSMQSDELQKNILSTYWTLRAGLVVLSFVFPLVLYFGGRWWGHVEREDYEACT